MNLYIKRRDREEKNKMEMKNEIAPFLTRFVWNFFEGNMKAIYE